MVKIVEVLAVRDTRDYVEQGDRFVPVPGSGESRECDRCGRLHEVHAEVRLSDGSIAVVGTGCAYREQLELEKPILSLERKAKRRAALQAELAVVEAMFEKRKAVEDEVWVTKPPAAQTTTHRQGFPIVHVGDAIMYAQFESVEATIPSAEQAWRMLETERQSGIKKTSYELKYHVKAVRERLERIT